MATQRPTTRPQRPAAQPLPRVATPASYAQQRPTQATPPWYFNQVRPQATAQVQRTINYRLVNVIKNAVIILMAMIICGLLVTLAREATQLANERSKITYVQVTTPAAGHNSVTTSR